MWTGWDPRSAGLSPSTTRLATRWISWSSYRRARACRGLDPSSLAGGKPVVTANKQVIAHAGPELLEEAARLGCPLRFEAAVAGGVPVVHAIEHGLAGDSLTRVAGILNGTCNYILSRMERERLPFAEALADAQALGFAEADPSQDIEGFDAQAKLAILAHIALRAHVPASAIQSRRIDTIDAVDFMYAEQMGCTDSSGRVGGAHRRSARADGRGRSCARAVRFAVGARSRKRESGHAARPIWRRNDIRRARGGWGTDGSGGRLGLLRHRSRSGAVRCPGGSAACRVSPEFTSAYYARFMVADRPGIIAALAAVFARHAINIDAICRSRAFLRAAARLSSASIRHLFGDRRRDSEMSALIFTESRRSFCRCSSTGVPGN